MSNAVIEREERRHEPNISEFMPALKPAQVVERYNAVVQLYRDVMKEGKDYGVIPGSDKPTLLKAGAEKLCTLFGLSVEDPEVMSEVEDWTGDAHKGEPFFYFKVRQRLSRHGVVVASQFASANSWESKHRYRWVNESEVPAGVNKSTLRTRGGKVSEFTFSVDKAETTGKYGKPASYWKKFTDAIANGTARKITKQTAAGKTFEAWEIDSVSYRVPNADAADVVNTLQKMAQKRALVAACLIATNCSEFFTQDIEEAEETNQHGEVIPPAPIPPAAQVSQAKPPSALHPPKPNGLKAGDTPGPKKAEPRPQFISKGELAELLRLMAEADADSPAFMHHYGVDDLAKFPSDRFSDAVLMLQRKIAKKQEAAAPAA